LIAFLVDSALFVMAPDGSSKRDLADVSVAPGPSSFQRWSPDGQRIAFMSSGESDELGVYVIDSDGSDVRLVSRLDTREPVLELSWSPDSRKLAISYLLFGNSGLPGKPRIHVVDVESYVRLQLTDGSAADISPAWSPDGSRIAFVSDRDGNREIYVMNADGTGQTRLTNHPLEDGSPSWSPDGRLILFVSNRDVDPQLPANSPSLYVPEIYVMNPDGSDQRNLSKNDEYDNFPTWAPAGDRIAFVSGRDGNAEIYVMKADGSEQRRLTSYECADGPPTWSPDGRRLAFTRWFHEPPYGDGTAEIFVIDVDGKNETRLTDNPGWDWLPAWSPH
jgi:Tol biopolymer transport system component